MLCSLAEVFGRLLLVGSSSANGYSEGIHKRTTKRQVTEHEVGDFGAALVGCRRREREELALVDGDGMPKDQEQGLKKNFFFELGRENMQFAKEGRRANFYRDMTYVVLAGVEVGEQELQ